MLILELKTQWLKDRALSGCRLSLEQVYIMAAVVASSVCVTKKKRKKGQTKRDNGRSIISDNDNDKRNCVEQTHILLKCRSTRQLYVKSSALFALRGDRIVGRNERTQMSRTFASKSASTSQHDSTASQYTYPFWPVVPLYPYGNDRRTVMKEVVEGEIYTFDQLFGTFYVTIPIRMTIIKVNRLSKDNTIKNKISGESGIETGIGKRLFLPAANEGGPGLVVYSPIAPTDECIAQVRKLEENLGCEVKHIISTSAQV